MGPNQGRAKSADSYLLSITLDIARSLFSGWFNHEHRFLTLRINPLDGVPFTDADLSFRFARRTFHHLAFFGEGRALLGRGERLNADRFACFANDPDLVSRFKVLEVV